MKELRRRNQILDFTAVSPEEAQARAFLREARPHAFPGAGAEKGFSATRHPCQSNPGEQSGVAAYSHREILRSFRQPRESPCASAFPIAGNHWIAFQRRDAVFSGRRPRREHYRGIFRGSGLTNQMHRLYRRGALLQTELRRVLSLT